MNYTFTVITKSGDAQTAPRMSLPISGVFTTKESVPGSLATFEAVDVKPSQIVFRQNFHFL
jgi:cadherin 5 type 2 (VE-cadherin)